MPNNTLRLQGLQELFEGLRTLPKELTGEATEIVYANADAARDEIKTDYPVRTGDLSGHVFVVHRSGPFVAKAVVKNTAALAFIFENGTEARHYITKNNVKHLTGRMPAGHVFIPAIIRRRRAMYEDLADMIETHGLTVSGGDAAA